MEDSTFPNSYNLNSNLKSSMAPESVVADFAASVETPDLRNWFSSYVYQSPELTSSCCYEDSFPIEGESTKDTGLYVEDSEGEEENARIDRANLRSNCPSIFVKNIGADGCSLHESLDGLDQQHKVPENSDSNPSQPPDIRNWFSSYVYESPMLDTAEIGCSLPTTIDTEHDFTQKDTTWTTIDDLIDDKSIQTDVVKRRKLIGCEKSETESAQLENGNEDQRNDLAKKLSIPGAISCCAEACKDEGNMEREEDEITASESCYKNSATSNEAAKSERDPGWVLPNGRSKQGSSRKKKFEPAENVGLMTGRKPLMEITNVCSSSGGGSNEIAGKWRCPQKTKPCIGPPLKQLRLDKWIHRV